MPPIILDHEWLTPGSREDTLARAILRDAGHPILARAPRLAPIAHLKKFVHISNLLFGPNETPGPRVLNGECHLTSDLRSKDELRAFVRPLAPPTTNLLQCVPDHNWCAELTWNDFIDALPWEGLAFDPVSNWMFLNYFGEFILTGFLDPTQILHIARIARFKTPQGLIVSKDRLHVRFADGNHWESARIGHAVPESEMTDLALALHRISGRPIEHHDLTPWSDDAPPALSFNDQAKQPPL